jgi:hypothetical protein
MAGWVFWLGLAVIAVVAVLFVVYWFASGNRSCDSVPVLEGRATKILGEGFHNPSIDSDNLGLVRKDQRSGGFLYLRSHVQTSTYIFKLHSNKDIEDMVLIDVEETIPVDLGWSSASGLMDCRIFSYNGEVWAIGNILGHSRYPDPRSHNMVLFKIPDRRKGTLCKAKLIRLEGPHPGTQKNWAPFSWLADDNEERLLVEYSLNPHTILDITPRRESGGVIRSQILCETRGYFEGGFMEYGSISSNLGLRLTTPPVLISDANIVNTLTKGEIRCKAYIGVGHEKKESFGYMHFFYLFEDRPPFKIIACSNQFKIHQNRLIQFCSGLRLLDDGLELQYGNMDKEAWLMVVSWDSVKSHFRQECK